MPQVLPEQQSGVKQPHVNEIDKGEEMVRTRRQVSSMPKIKYMHFDDDVINYASFMHNFDKFRKPICTRAIQYS